MSRIDELSEFEQLQVAMEVVYELQLDMKALANKAYEKVSPSEFKRYTEKEIRACQVWNLLREKLVRT